DQFGRDCVALDRLAPLGVDPGDLFGVGPPGDVLDLAVDLALTGPEDLVPDRLLGEQPNQVGRTLRADREPGPHDLDDRETAVDVAQDESDSLHFGAPS